MHLKLAMVAILVCGAVAAAPEAMDRKDLERRAKAGDADAVHALCYAQLYGKGLRKSPRRAFRWCKEGARLGFSSSQTLLAEMYLFGYHVSQDDAEARRWYEAAANQGHVHAQFVLGRLVFQYAETTEDAQRACRWFQAAAHAGYGKAREQLGDLDQKWVALFQGKPPREHFCEQP